MPREIQNVALRKLRLMNAARRLHDLSVPPGNRLEALRADRTGQHSIRINDQWRICFVWTEGGPDDVEIAFDPSSSESSAGLYPIELTLAVESALRRLSDDQREAVLLKVYQGFKFEEMAEILSCPVSTIKSRLYTALDLLKDTLAPVKTGGEA